MCRNHGPGFGIQCCTNIYAVDTFNALPGVNCPHERLRQAYTIQVGPIDDAEPGDQLCLDSSFFQPAGTWKWGSPDVYASWGGPYCYGFVSNPDIIAGYTAYNCENHPYGNWPSLSPELTLSGSVTIESDAASRAPCHWNLGSGSYVELKFNTLDMIHYDSLELFLEMTGVDNPYIEITINDSLYTDCFQPHLGKGWYSLPVGTLGPYLLPGDNRFRISYPSSCDASQTSPWISMVEVRAYGALLSGASGGKHVRPQRSTSIRSSRQAVPIHP